MKVRWHATYLGADFLKARRERLASLQEWSSEERGRQEMQDQKELREHDSFFVVIYAGSSAFPEVGKDTGKWRISLESGDKQARPVQFETVSVTEVERGLYPFLDKWSRAYLLRFPKTIQEGKPFVLKMQGVPAKSELAWK